MKTVTEWYREQCGWRQERCYCSGGDFCGPKECSSCGGNGSYRVTPRGRHVLYPGGPFC
jgi:hypothetical protein